MRLISKETIKTCVRLFLCLILSVLCGMTLLVLVNYLPSERIKNNVRSGAQIILQENAEFQYADGYVEAILDNYTDALILSKVVYPSDHPLKDAVMVPSYSFPGQDVEGMQLFGTLNDNPLDDVQVDTYARYWHGYLAVLKPFFTFFSYADFRILNQAAELILMLMIAVLMQKRHLGFLIPAYVGMLILWNPGTMGVSLQYAPCCYISLGAAAFILWTSRYYAEFQKILFLFFFCGILTAYLDFLTYPIATLGIPLIFWILTETSQSRIREKSESLKIGLLCIVWVGGYLGMWAGKWILGTLLSGENILSDAALNVANRTSTQDGGQSLTRSGVVMYLIRYTFGKKPYLLLMIVLIGAIMMWLHMKKKLLKDKNNKAEGIMVPARKNKCIWLVLVGGLPFLWYFVTANHSFIHPRLVYRAMGVTVLAWISAALLVVQSYPWRIKDSN